MTPIGAKDRKEHSFIFVGRQSHPVSVRRTTGRSVDPVEPVDAVGDAIRLEAVEPVEAGVQSIGVDAVELGGLLGGLAVLDVPVDRRALSRLVLEQVGRVLTEIAGVDVGSATPPEVRDGTIATKGGEGRTPCLRPCRGTWLRRAPCAL